MAERGRMFKILGGVVEGLAYRSGLPIMIVSLGEGGFNKFNIYLNPKIKPELKEPVGKEILLIEGEFLPQDGSLFFPHLIVMVDENELTDHKLCF